MHHHRARRALAGVAVAITSIALAACGDERPSDVPAASESTTSTTTAGAGTQPPAPPGTGAGTVDISVSLIGGAVDGEVRTEVVGLDETVRLEVSGDAEDEVHVHTYDLFGDVSPGSPAVIEFVADIPGVHEVELEGSHRTILQLQVEP